MLAQFALRLICGMSLMWGAMPRREVTSGFFRIQMLIALGLSVLATLAFGRMSEQTEVLLSVGGGRVLCGALAVCGFLGSVMWTLERRRMGSAFVFAVAGLSTVTLLLGTVPWNNADPSATAFHALSELASAAVLGAAVTGMLLGHWYLTAPTMSTAPLGRLNGYLAASVAVRLVLSIIGAGIAWTEIVDRSDWLMWFVLRWVAGIISPLILTVMVWRILKYRNTQSATGVLFAATILVFLGELAAALLTAEVGVPM